MEKRRASAALGVGASSLLVIFAVLCLAVFALLSVATVQADERLGDSAEAAVLGYYQADREAERILAQIRAGELPEGVYAEKGIYSYGCIISETQVLAVRVAVTEEDYEILRWQAVSTADWQPEDGIPVWTGQGYEEERYGDTDGLSDPCGTGGCFRYFSGTRCTGEL